MSANVLISFQAFAFTTWRLDVCKLYVRTIYVVRIHNIPGDPRKCDELVFLKITLKVVKIEPNYWVEKKQNLIRIFHISMI